MAKAPTTTAQASHYEFYILTPVTAAGENFVPGVRYTAKAAVYEQVKACADPKRSRPLYLG